MQYLLSSGTVIKSTDDGQWRMITPENGRKKSCIIPASLVIPMIKCGYLRLTAQREIEITAAGRAEVDQEARYLAIAEGRLREDKGKAYLVNLKENPLAWLARRGKTGKEPFLRAHHLQAGERLRSDITFAQMVPRMGARWDEIRSGYRPDQSSVAEGTHAARERVSRALEHVGQELSGILIDVCGHGKGLEVVEKERQWPSRAAKVILRMALESLARHYGYSDAATGPAVRAMRARRA